MNKTENLTPEQAVEILNGKGDHISTLKRVQANRMGAEAIERCMIAQKPDYEADGYAEDGELIYDTAYCPNCRHLFEDIDFDRTSYCPDCGQKLDWSDTE